MDSVAALKEALQQAAARQLPTSDARATEMLADLVATLSDGSSPADVMVPLSPVAFLHGRLDMSSLSAPGEPDPIQPADLVAWLRARAQGAGRAVQLQEDLAALAALAGAPSDFTDIREEWTEEEYAARAGAVMPTQRTGEHTECTTIVLDDASLFAKLEALEEAEQRGYDAASVEAVHAVPAAPHISAVPVHLHERSASATVVGDIMEREVGAQAAPPPSQPAGGRSRFAQERQSNRHT